MGKEPRFFTATFYKATDPLMTSGLIGPVQIRFFKYSCVNTEC